MSFEPGSLRTALAQEATALLSMSAGAWTSAGGVLDSWDDERLLDEGRRLYHGDATALGGDDPDALSPLAERSRYRFWARAAPWYLRLKRDAEVPRPDWRVYPADVVVSGARPHCSRRLLVCAGSGPGVRHTAGNARLCRRAARSQSLAVGPQLQRSDARRNVPPQILEGTADIR